MPQRPELTTERLWLRPLRDNDAADLHVAYADAECLRFWHHPPSADLAATAEVVARVAADDGHWAFGRRDGDASQTVLGYTGFVNGLEPAGHAGFGYLLRRAAWGNGYAAEASLAALAHGFDAVGIARAELWIQRGNRQSVRTAEKLGCRLRTDAPTLVYGLTAEQWRGEDDPPPVHLGAEPILGVRDVEVAVQWWVDVLGFRAGFRYGSPPTHAAVLAGPGWTGGPRVQLTHQVDAPPATVYVGVSDLDAAAERARSAGATVVTPLGVRPWGVRELELADPDGNRIRLG
jgi:RimJ/RimL family protein N-acetyltransferase/catechol 2,3-dioxygenase-like lactoylglutathione lyase family enzyme